MSVRFWLENPPSSGDKIMLFPKIDPKYISGGLGPFTVDYIIEESGYIRFTDRPNGLPWKLHRDEKNSNCELYSPVFKYDPTQAGDTDEDV